MQEIFGELTKALDGTPAIALPAAFAWGVLSILLSPCHLASIPLIIGYIGDQGRTSIARAFAIASFFSVGILITIAAIGVATSLAGRIAGDMGAWTNYFVAIVFFAVGLHLLEIIRLPMPDPKAPNARRKGLLGAFLLGLLFGVALGPCTFAYMAPLLALSFKTAPDGFIYAASLLAAYGVGHCAVIVLAGTSTELVQRYLNWGEASKTPVLVKKACGALVVIGGFYLIYAAR
jgi:cytochrome c-type biogenesis protein